MTALASILLYFFVFAISALIIQYGYKHKSKGIQVIGLLLPIFLGGLRYGVGLDYFSYLDAFADVVNPQTVDYRYVGTPNLEYSFYLISHISNFIFSSPVAVYFVYSAITVSVFYCALSLMQPKNVGIALFFFYSIFFLNSFNIMRQGAAISIGCLALAHYANGSKFKAFLYILIAMAFHISALIIVSYIVIERLFEKKNIMKEKFGGVFLRTFIVSGGIATVGWVSPSVREFVYSVTGRIGELSSTFSMGVVFKYALCLASLYLVIYAWKNFSGSQKRFSLLVALGAIIYALGMIHNEAARLGIYLVALTPILFAIAYDNLKLYRIRNRFLINGGLIILCMSYIVAVHVESGNGVQYDYQDVIMSEEYPQRVRELGL